MTQTELAKRLGVTPSAVSQMLSKGRLGKGGPGNAVTAKDSLGNELTLTDAQVRKEISLGEKQALEVAERKGTLAPVLPMMNFFAGLIIKANGVWNNLQHGLRAQMRLAGITDEAAADVLSWTKIEFDRGLEELKVYTKFAGGKAAALQQAEKESGRETIEQAEAEVKAAIEEKNNGVGIQRRKARGAARGAAKAKTGTVSGKAKGGRGGRR